MTWIVVQLYDVDLSDNPLFLKYILRLVSYYKKKNYHNTIRYFYLFLPVAKIDFGYHFESELEKAVTAKTLQLNRKQKSLDCAFNFLRVACKEVLKRLPTSLNFLTDGTIFLRISK